ncbi:MAG: alkaline phosphatase family protein [Chloroflexi bacterium]|nr:alkaline phosphatase family protein [Chloroflexota bacterium]
MNKPRGLVIVHVDGLGHDYLLQALRQGQMPFAQYLIEHEGYEPLRYRCGLPSTTPFCQAGVLYGNNAEIPSFRWWDKESGVLVSFGGLSGFKQVEHKYFKNCEPLTRDGAAIATIFLGSAHPAYRVGYREHGRSLEGQNFSHRRVVRNWALNPIHLLDWLRRGLWQIWQANLQYWLTRWRGRPAAKMYVISDMLEEILMHQLTRFAAVQAMQENYPAIFVGFYAYDETAHAFGPDADYSFRILRHVDNTIRRIAAKRHSAREGARNYELVILSDHGQIETVPFERAYGRRFGEIVAEWLPTFEVEEHKGKRMTRRGPIDGHIVLCYSGGLAHLYWKDISWRLRHDEIQERFPGLIDKAAATPGIAFVLTREGTDNVITTEHFQVKFDGGRKLPRAARDLLARYDEPEIIARQLQKLNSFERSGDLILFGADTDHHQINFEDQVGGHGSLGGAQLFPFILAKREWKFDTANIADASDLYHPLKRLRDQLVK